MHLEAAPRGEVGSGKAWGDGFYNGRGEELVSAAVGPKRPAAVRWSPCIKAKLSVRERWRAEGTRVVIVNAQTYKTLPLKFSAAHMTVAGLSSLR